MADFSATGVVVVLSVELVQLANSVAIGIMRVTERVVTTGTRIVVCPPAEIKQKAQHLRMFDMEWH